MKPFKLLLLLLTLQSPRLFAERFIDRMQPTSPDYVFQMEGYWVWGMSVIKGDDGLYHGFAARWSKKTPFGPNWVSNSEVVHATSKTPEGPYQFESVALERRDKSFFDGEMTHNPTIHKSGDTYLLFYTGTTYDFPFPEEGITRKMYVEARANQRIGLATSKSPYGPWTRSDTPIIEPRPGKWDALITVNPAVCVKPSGEILLVYKSTADQRGKLKLGIAMAEDYTKPFKRLSDDPIFQFDDPKKHVEDPYIWWNGSGYELVMKDMTGAVCGERGAGVHAASEDGINWTISDSPLAYTKTIKLKDGSTLKTDKFERAQVLVQDNKPTHLFFAIGINQEGKKGGGYEALGESRNICIPLK